MEFTMRYLACICCFAVLLGLSVPALAMSLTDFESRCTMGLNMGDNDVCASKQDICGSFMDLMANAKDKAACKQACSNAEASEHPRHVVDGCDSSVQHAYSECTIYCEELGQ